MIENGSVSASERVLSNFPFTVGINAYVTDVKDFAVVIKISKVSSAFTGKCSLKGTA